MWFRCVWFGSVWSGSVWFGCVWFGCVCFVRVVCGGVVWVEEGLGVWFGLLWAVLLGLLLLLVVLPSSVLWVVLSAPSSGSGLCFFDNGTETTIENCVVVKLSFFIIEKQMIIIHPFDMFSTTDPTRPLDDPTRPEVGDIGRASPCQDCPLCGASVRSLACGSLGLCRCLVVLRIQHGCQWPPLCGVVRVRGEESAELLEVTKRSLT